VFDLRSWSGQLIPGTVGPAVVPLLFKSPKISNERQMTVSMTYLEKQFWQEFGPNPLNQLIMPVNTQCKHMEVNGRATKRRGEEKRRDTQGRNDGKEERGNYD
jgi:hypothetical protein